VCAPFFPLAEDTMNENLYDLIGGHQTIRAATKRFYEKVLADENLRHFLHKRT
jgi:truncated hemoglobin YjbI